MTDTAKPVLGKWTGLYKQKGFVDAAKDGLSDIKKGAKFWDESSKGFKGVAFGRTVGVTAGVAMAGDALFRGKTADGEDRSALARLGQGVLGLGIAGGSLVAGAAR